MPDIAIFSTKQASKRTAIRVRWNLCWTRLLEIEGVVLKNVGGIKGQSNEAVMLD